MFCYCLHKGVKTNYLRSKEILERLPDTKSEVLWNMFIISEGLHSPLLQNESECQKCNPVHCLTSDAEPLWHKGISRVKTFTQIFILHH